MPAGFEALMGKNSNIV